MINALMNPGEIGASVQNSFMQGMEMRRQADMRNALAAYGMNPNEETLGGVMRHDPATGIALRDQMAQQQAAQQQREMDQLGQVARLFDGVTPENYQQRLQIAQQIGLPLDGVPQEYDPQWVQQTGALYQFLASPTGREVMSTAGKIAYDEGLQPGTPEFAARVSQLAEQEAQRLVSWQAGGGAALVGPGGEAQIIVAPGDQGQMDAPEVLPPDFFEGGSGGNAAGGF